ncbi:MAG: CapA family protein [Candidatus Paceibacterota bacterium]
MKLDWKLYLITGIGLISALFLLFLVNQQKAFYNKLSYSLEAKLQTEGKLTTTLLFTGDIMLDRGVEKVVKKYGEDYEFPFLKIKDYLQNADILFGNLESVISDEGYQIKPTYPFRAEPRAKYGLGKAGFDVVSCANNHSLDYGAEALRDSIDNLKQVEISCVGAGVKEEACAPVVKKKNDLKVAYLAYTYLAPEGWVVSENKTGIAWLNEKNLKQGVNEAEQKADLVVVSFHFGKEYEKKPNSHQKSYSHLAIDSGADLVIGHHPHVVQTVEQYKDGWIAYSLGNFVFDQNFSKETMKGLILEVEVKDKKIKRVTPRRVTINDYFQPVLD